MTIGLLVIAGYLCALWAGFALAAPREPDLD